MPTKTYIPLATATLASASSSITFGSIPQTYRDLIISTKSPGSLVEGGLRFNGDAGSNYFRVYMLSASGGAPVSGTDTHTSFKFNGSTEDQNILQIMDYSATDKPKITFNRFGSTSLVLTGAIRWANNSPINSIVYLPLSGTLPAGTIISLYGIAS